MRKELMKNLVKQVRKDNIRTMYMLNPTLEECDYLYEKGINTTRSYSVWTGFIYEIEPKLYTAVTCSVE